MVAPLPFGPQSSQELVRSWLPAPYRQELAYRVAGEGRPVVFLHGMWNSSVVWKRTFDLFSPHYRLYAPDIPGHGQSPARLPWRLREVAALLAAWMRSLEMPPAAIVGHSMGGALAIILAAAEPQLVDRLVLVNTAGLPTQRFFLRALASAGLGFANHPNIRYTSRYGDPRRVQSLSTWQAMNELLVCDVRPDLRLIRCPTLIIWGMRDLLLPAQSAVLVQRSIQGAELVMLPNIRHDPLRQAPDTFHAVLEDFLGRWNAADQFAEQTGD